MTVSEANLHAPILGDDREVLDAAVAVAAELRPGSLQRDREGRHPTEALRVVAASGLLGATVPRELGGADVRQTTIIEVFRLIGTADPSVAQILLVHFGIVEGYRRRPASAVSDAVLRGALDGKRVGNAIAERGTKHTAELRVRFAWQPDGRLRVDGRKYYATGAREADFLEVLGDIDGARASVFFLPGTPGIEFLDDWDSFGQRSTASGSVVFDGALAEPEWVTVLPTSAPLSLSTPSNQARHAGIAAGIARAAFEDGLDFVRTRTRPFPDSGLERVTDEPHVLLRIGQLATKLDALESLLRRRVQDIDDAYEAPLTREVVTSVSLGIASAKALAAEVALETATSVLELAGSASTDASYGLDRHWRNARVLTLHDPARWKYHHIGNFVLNGRRPPASHLI